MVTAAASATRVSVHYKVLVAVIERRISLKQCIYAHEIQMFDVHTHNLYTVAGAAYRSFSDSARRDRGS
jgi:hypothetical protein